MIREKRERLQNGRRLSHLNAAAVTVKRHPDAKRRSLAVRRRNLRLRNGNLRLQRRQVTKQRRIEVSPNTKDTPSKDVENTSKTPVKNLQTLQTHQKTPVKRHQTQKSKTPKKRMEEPPIHTPSKHSKGPKTPNKSTQTSHTPKKIQAPKTPNKRTQTSHTPKKIQAPKSPNKRTQTSLTPNKMQASPFEDISSLVGSSLDLLNEGSEAFNPSISSTPHLSRTTEPPTPSTSYSQLEFSRDIESHGVIGGEFGYNASPTDVSISQTTMMNSFPFQPLIDYYQSLSHENQTHVLSIFHLLSSAFHQTTYGGIGRSESFIVPSISNQDTAVIQQKENIERKLPLLKDENDLFDDVVVNPASLRTSEMKALTAKNPALYLLNKVLDMVFTTDELKYSKGAKGLNKHKMDAIREYMFAKCKKLNIDDLQPRTFTATVQNKMGNARKAGSEKPKLAPKIQ